MKSKNYFELEIEETTYIISSNSPKNVYFIYDAKFL